MWEIVTNGTKYRLRSTKTGKYELTYVACYWFSVPVIASYKSLEEAKAAKSALEEADRKYKQEHKQENTWVKVEDN